jgi:hypothetical protein
MSDDDTNTDEHDGNGYAEPVMDPFTVALSLCQIAAKPATYAAALKKLRKLGRDIAAAEQKLAALTDQAEQKLAEFAARAVAIDERERAISERESSFEASLREAHDSLRQYHDNLAQEDRRIRYRILSHADLLHGYNSRLQDLPDWQQIKQMVPGLPPDLPATPPAEVVSENVREDWSGNVFAPSTLTRSIVHKVTSQ